MQRPYEVLERGSRFDEVQAAQQRNLTSAVAYAAMTTPSGSDERKLYQAIVQIPHYDRKSPLIFLTRVCAWV